MPGPSTASDRPRPDGDGGRILAAHRILAEVAGELAGSRDIPEHRRAPLRRVARLLAIAMENRPDSPEAWAAAAPFVCRRDGSHATLAEMLLVPDVDDPRRTARLLLRALDWELPE